MNQHIENKEDQIAPQQAKYAVAVIAFVCKCIKMELIIKSYFLLIMHINQQNNFIWRTSVFVKVCDLSKFQEKFHIVSIDRYLTKHECTGIFNKHISANLTVSGNYIDILCLLCWHIGICLDISVDNFPLNLNF